MIGFISYRVTVVLCVKQTGGVGSTREEDRIRWESEDQWEGTRLVQVDGSDGGLHIW